MISPSPGISFSRRRPDWHCKCINAWSHLRSSICLCIRKTSSSLSSSSKFQSWKYSFGDREIPIRILFSSLLRRDALALSLSIINAPETSLLTASFAIINLPLDSNRQFARLNATLRSFAVHVLTFAVFMSRGCDKSSCLFSVGEGFPGETAAFARL